MRSIQFADELLKQFADNQKFEFSRKSFCSRVIKCRAFPRAAGGFVVIETDDTDLHNKAHMLENLAVTLRTEKDKSDTASRAKSEFVANMSHEIRTPLNGVIGMADVLSRTGLDESQSDMLDVVVSSSNALLTVINDILDFSKIEAGKMKLI